MDLDWLTLYSPFPSQPCDSSIALLPTDTPFSLSPTLSLAPELPPRVWAESQIQQYWQEHAHPGGPGAGSVEARAAGLGEVEAEARSGAQGEQGGDCQVDRGVDGVGRICRQMRLACG